MTTLATATVAQALVRFLAQQYSERDGERQRLIPGCFGIFGHGNVAGVGQARWRQRPPSPAGGRKGMPDMYPCDFSKPKPIAERTFRYLNANGLGGTA